MKLLGKLNASSLVAGDLIRIAGYVTKVSAVSITGANVTVETEMFEAVSFGYCDKVSLFSEY